MSKLLDIDEIYLFQKLIEILPKKGIFIEVGANDGNKYSHCSFLKKNNWEGYCIEANPEIAEVLYNNNKNYKNIHCFNYAITDQDNKDILFYIESSSMSGVSSLYKSRANSTDADNSSSLNRIIKKNVKVVGKKLNTFVKELNITECDLLLTDCEGEDINILLSTDFSIFKPKYIMSETTFLFYYKNIIQKDKNRRQITQEVYDLLLTHMEKFNYKLILSNDMIDYKKKYFPYLLGFPMNCVWELQLGDHTEDNKEP